MAKSSPAAAAKASTVAPAVPPALTNQDTIDAYQDLYNALGRAYWDASDLHSKDTVQGARDAVFDIITQLDEQDLQANTQKFLALLGTVNDTNKALAGIRDQITQITKNINTAANVIAAISKVLSFTSGL